MRVLLLSGLLVMVLGASLASAGSPHFVSCSSTVNGAEVCLAAKEAGLGDEEQIDVSLSVIAHCQNRGGKDPSAENKTTFSTAAIVPVQNGKSVYELCVTTSFSPNCAPPMSVIVDSISLVDTTHTIACVLE